MRKSFFEDGEKSGYDRGKIDGEKFGYGKGKADGEAEGEERLARLIAVLFKENKLEEIRLVSANETARKEYYKKYHIQ